MDNAVFGRMGGEEFAIVCNSETKDFVLDSIEKIRKKISQLKIVVDEETSINITISEGVSKATSDINNLDALLKEADIALYEAKDGGRDRVIFR